MVNKEFRYTVKVDDAGSLKKVDNSAKEAKQDIDALTTSAGLLSKALKTASSASIAIAKNRGGARAQEADDLVAYNSLRGTAQAAGGGARDFAAQSQGLGGVVRLYATFAANVFAVSTAFTALKNAFNTEKLVQSSEKFSAVTGTNLRSISKSLQEATDNTLSFQDAVKFTNIGTAAGLSGKAIKELTVIARGAANALGRDVGESIQRIIQGTAKQEQEILDELGIFVKSKKAFEDYANARNIKADDLTARERTLAYADAVAKAGEQWKQFADIPDPYAQLTAQSKEALQSVLKVVNDFITPFISLLAKSEGAIISLAGIISTFLIKQAFPGLKFGFLSLAADSKKGADGILSSVSDIKTKLIKEYTSLNTQLAGLKKTRDELIAGKPERLDNLKSVINNIGGEALKPRRGGDGLNATTITTAIFGTDGKPKDLSAITGLADVEDRIAKTLKEQLKNEETRKEVLSSLVSKKILEEGSTEKNLILGQKSKQVAKDVFAEVTRQLAVEKEILRTKQEIAVVSKATRSAGSSLAGAGVTAAEIATVSSAPSTPSGSVGVAAGAAASAASVSKLTAANTAFQAGQAASTRAYQLFVTALGSGTGQFKAIIGYFAALRAGAVASTAGLTGLTRAAAVTGVAVSALTGGVRILIGAISTLATPLLIAYTLWELFGDAIKEFFGFSKSAEDRTKALSAASEELSNNLKTTAASLDLTNKKLETAKGDEYVRVLEARANAFREGFQAFEKYRESIQTAETSFGGRGNTKEDLKKTYGSDNVDVASQAKSLVTLLEAAKSSGSLTSQVAADAAKGIETLGSKLELLGKTKGSAAAEELKAAMTSLGPVVEASTRQASGAIERSLASLQRGISGIAGISEVAEAIDSRRLEAAAQGFKDNTDALKLFKGLTAAAESYNKTSDPTQRDTLRTKEIEGLKDLVQKTGDFKTASEEVLKVRELIAQVLAFEATLASSSASVVDKILAAGGLTFVQQQLFSLTTSSETARLALTEGFAPALATAGKATEDLSDRVKAALRPIKTLIEGIEGAIRGLKSQIAVADNIQSSISKIGGTVSLSDPRQLDVLAKEAELAKAKALASKTEADIRAKGDKGALSEAQEQYSLALRLADETLKQETLLVRLNNIEKEATNTAKASAEERSKGTKALESNTNLARALTDIDKERSSVLATLSGQLSEETAFNDALLNQKRALVEQDTAILKLAADKAAQEALAREAFDTASRKAAEAGDTGAAKQAREELDKQTAKIQANFQTELTATMAVNNVLNERVNIQLELLDLQRKQAKESTKINKSSEIFVKIFQGTGLAKQAKAISDIAKISVTSKQKLASLDLADKKRRESSLVELSELEQKANQGSLRDYENLVDFKARQNEMEMESASARKDLELEYAAEAVGSFKQLFDEKTAGYKILDGIERTLHAVRMAESVERTAQMIADGAKQVASLISTIAKDGVAAVLNQGKGDPYSAFARMAAMAAFVAALTGKGGGKAPSAPPGGTTAKDRQEVQGTGFSFVDGVKKENGGGVFGDAEAKSESIKRSLEVIEDNSIEGLSFDNKMLKALQSIDNAISGVSTSLYRIPGIRTGSVFGTVEGTQKGGGTLQNFVSQIFGKKSVSTEILDSGVKIAGTFTELAKATTGLINFYETIQTTTTNSRLFGLSKSTSTQIATNTTGASSEITTAVGSIFAFATDLFIDVGAKLGKSSEDILSKLETVSFDQLLSLRGLKGEELEKEFNAVISSMLDSTSNLLFAELKEFQKFGEGMLETVVRVVDGNKKVNDSLNAIGQNSALKSLNRTLDFKVTEDLIEASGGLEEFQSRIGSFRDNFLTDAEKLAPVAAAVSAEMTRLGHSTVDTKEEFKALVQALDLTIPSQREMYVSLLEVSEAFAMVADAAAATAKQTLSVEEFRDRIFSLETEGLRKLGGVTAAIAAERNKELEAINKLVPEQADQLIYYQRILYAIEDAMETRNAEIELLGSLGFTYDQLVLQRELELASLSDNVRALRKWQFAVEDYNNSQGLLIELLQKSGDTTKATAISRERELRGLNAVDKAIKRGIFALEDEEAIRSKLQEAKERELSTKEEEYEAIKSSTSATRDYIKSLKDYRDSLVLGSLSPLNPLQRYQEAQRQAVEAARIATGPANTEEEKRAQKAARDKLQSTTNAFLESARVLFASGSAYTSDFNSSLATIDRAIASAGSEITVADRQLEVLQTQKDSLKSIEEDSKTVAQLTTELLSAQQRTANALAAIPADLATTYNINDLLTGVSALPQAIRDLPTVISAAVASVTPTGTAVLPDISAFLAALGYEGTITQGTGGTSAATAQVDQAIYDIQANSLQGNELTRELITEISNLKDELVRLIGENRQNTEALVNAEFVASNSNAEQVQEGFDRSVRAVVFSRDNNSVTLR